MKIGLLSIYLQKDFAMPQMILPMIPMGSTVISDLVSVVKTENKCVYFLSMYPIYSHEPDDIRSFKLVTSQLIDSGACRHRDIMNTFGVSKSSVNRALKKYREGGIEAFFRKKKGGRRGTALTPEKLVKAQAMLDEGMSRIEVSEELGVRKDTLRKAINDGRLNEPSKTPQQEAERASVKSTRNSEDNTAAEGIGTACTRPMARVAASIGGLDGAPTEFEACLDVPNGGVLCALPALLANGLLDGVQNFLGKIKGYYTIFHILLILAFMGLCRIKTVEKLRGYPPGELGKLVGIDRAPEARCLRDKMDDMSAQGAAEKWSAHLSKKWMEDNADAAGTLYVDGHVRVYNGDKTKLPRRYVSRQRLCLRATTDYWVNDAVGRPFFVVEKPIDPGLLETLEQDIVPRLLKDVPNQPTEKELEQNPFLPRFVIVFDREGYSPAFFKKIWKKHRIACMTYRKYCKEPWPEERFEKREVEMPSGEIVEMKLAEMGTLIGSKKDGVWMREIRKLSESGHQTSLMSTDFNNCDAMLAARMFTRWCQENFFRYMRQHFEFDMLQQYGVEPIPDTEKVVNPAWRELDKSRNRLVNKLRYRRANFAAMTMHPESEKNPKKYSKWLEKKSRLLEEIEQFEMELNDLKSRLKETKKHVNVDELKEEDVFFKLSSGRKRLMDTIRMIAYRAETAMIPTLKDSKTDSAEVRRLLQDLFKADADILPDVDNGILLVRVHNASWPSANRHIAKLLEELNSTETKFPNTDFLIVYELVV